MITIAAINKVFGFEFSAEQVQSITAPLAEPLQVIAGAGSGKTTVMVARIVWAVAQGFVRPDQVLGLTFTNKAAGELGRSVAEKLERLDDLGLLPVDPEQVDAPTVSTYHAFAHRLVADFGLRVGVEPGARLLADGESAHLAYQLVVDSELPLQDLGKGPKGIAEYVINLDGELSEQVVTTDQVRKHSRELVLEIDRLEKTVTKDLTIAKTAKNRILYADLVDEFRELKRDLGVVDFSDLMRHVEQLSHDPLVVAEVRDKYQMVLLDEYQDTSVVQARFLHQFFGAGHPVTAVGDPFQAIYGWRGASEMAMSEFPSLFTKSDGIRSRQTRLVASRRCAPTILTAANEVAEQLRSDFPEVHKLVSVDSTNNLGSVRASMWLTSEEEFAWIADTIAKLIEADVEPADIAILCRENKTMRPIVEQLSIRGIKSQISDIGGLLAQPEIVDLVSWLRILDDPGANPALLRILQGPRWRIGHRDLAKLGRRAKDLLRNSHLAPASTLEAADDLQQVLQQAVQGTDVVDIACLLDAVESPVDSENPARYGYSDGCLERLGEIKSILDELRGLKLLSLPELARYVARITGLEAEVTLAALAVEPDAESGSVKPDIALDRGLTAMNEFYDLLNRFGASTGDQSLSAFIHWLDLSAMFDNDVDLAIPRTGSAVQFLTVHGAKGLEWKHVFVPRMVESVFPSNTSRPRWTERPDQVPHPLRGDRLAIPDQKGFGTNAFKDFMDSMKLHAEREERRLAYVALTRAEDALYASGSYWTPGRVSAQQPSRYLLSVKESMAQTAVELDHWEDAPGDENPLIQDDQLLPWPKELNKPSLKLRQLAQAEVAAANESPSLEPHSEASESERNQLARWDEDLELLLAERRSYEQPVVPKLPRALSASKLMKLESDRAEFLAQLARPMPVAPSYAADRGTQFHNWVEQYFGMATLFDDYAGESVVDELTEQELKKYQDYFLTTDYSKREPYAIELPFDFLLAGTVLRGRIDAVYRSVVAGQEYWEVVDWKTNKQPTADPIQLGIYALAIQRIFGVDPRQITASFVYVNAQQIVTYKASELSAEADISRILLG